MNESKIEEIRNTAKTLKHLREEYWRTEAVFSYQWWLLIVGCLLIVAIWCRLVDRSRLVPILLFGITMLFIITLLDIGGADRLLWDYPIMVLPWGCRQITVDIIMTIVFMFNYQWFRGWGWYIAANAATALLFAFVLEPAAMKINIYLPFEWKHIYSLGIFFLLALAVKLAVEIVLRRQRQRSFLR